MHPEIHLNIVSLIAATLASFVFGFLWYGPLFGKKWAALMNLKMENGKMEWWYLPLTLVGTALTSYVMVYTTNVWRASVWNAGVDSHFCIYGFFSGFYTWLGFFLPMGFGTVTWEGRPWKLFGLNTVYHFLNLQLIATIVAYGSK